MADVLPAPPPSLEHVRKNRKPLRDVNAEHQQSLSTLDRLACWSTDKVGTMGFFLIILGWTVVWLGWNLLTPAKPVHVFWTRDLVNLRFDPGMAFVFYLFISNVIQILLMPLIMVGQNVQGLHSELRAQSDLDVNVKAEQEIETILQHLEYQNTILLDLVKKVDITLADAVRTRHAQSEATRSAIETLAGKMHEPIPFSAATITDETAGGAPAPSKKPEG